MPGKRPRMRTGEAPYPSKALAVLDIHRRDRLLEVVAAAAQELLRSGDLAVSLQKVIELVGQATDADRAHIFLIQATGEKGRIVDHYVWAAPGVSTPPGFENAKGLMADVGLRSWVPRLERAARQSSETFAISMPRRAPCSRAAASNRSYACHCLPTANGRDISASTTAAVNAIGPERK